MLHIMCNFKQWYKQSSLSDKGFYAYINFFLRELVIIEHFRAQHSQIVRKEMKYDMSESCLVLKGKWKENKKFLAGRKMQRKSSLSDSAILICLVLQLGLRGENWKVTFLASNHQLLTTAIQNFVKYANFCS